MYIIFYDMYMTCIYISIIYVYIYAEYLLNVDHMISDVEYVWLIQCWIIWLRLCAYIYIWLAFKIPGLKDYIKWAQLELKS